MTDKQLLELKEQRAKLIKDNRAVIEKREKDKEEITAEDSQEMDKRYTEADNLKDQITIEERQRASEAEVETSQRQTTAVDPTTERAVSKPENAEAGPVEYRHALANGRERVVRFGASEQKTSEYRTAYASWLQNGVNISMTEARALQNTDQTLGGYLTPDQQMVAGMIKFVDDAVLIRQLATVHLVPNADSLGAVSLDTDVSDSDWTTELLTGGEDSSMKFGKRELAPHPLAKLIKISKTLIRKAPDIVGLVTERLSYKKAVTEEKAFLTGDGNQRALGVFTASSDGISTGRDVSDGNTTTAITVDNLINVVYNLKQQYRNSSSTAWMFHRDAIRNIRKLKDGEGQYLWQPSIAIGQPDSLLNFRVMESEFAPNTFTAGLYVGMLADWRFYWIADALNITIQRLEEKYALTNQTGFILRAELDGMPVLEEAFARVKLAP